MELSWGFNVLKLAPGQSVLRSKYWIDQSRIELQKAANKVLRYLQGTKDHLLTNRRSSWVDCIFKFRLFQICWYKKPHIRLHIPFCWRDNFIEECIPACQCCSDAEFVASFESTIHGLWLQIFFFKKWDYKQHCKAVFVNFATVFFFRTISII